MIDLGRGNWHALQVPLHDNEFELIELTHRAREFLLLDVNENQKNLVATVAQSFADALFPPVDYENGAPLPWIRGVLHNSKPAAFISWARLSLSSMSTPSGFSQKILRFDPITRSSAVA